MVKTNKIVNKKVNNNHTINKMHESKTVFCRTI